MKKHTQWLLVPSLAAIFLLGCSSNSVQRAGEGAITGAAAGALTDLVVGLEEIRREFGY